MQADIFYQATSKSSLPIVFLSKTQCNDDNSGLTAFEKNCLTTQQFKGALGDVGLIFNSEGNPVKIYVGIADGKETLALAQAVHKLPPGTYHAVEPLSLLSMLTWSLAQYRFDRYKTSNTLPRVLVVGGHLSTVLIRTNAIFLVRDLINMPANDLNPQTLADIAEKVASTHHAEFKQWVGDALIEENFPGIHAVGRAASKAPRLISIAWGNPQHPRVTLVGKGVCFDSGGLDIKPSSGMRLMKKDMGGAAQVLGLAQWLMSERLPIRLQVLIPAVENAVGSQSYRPGDVITMRNGLAVEIDNTDAEGRVILADAIVKACEEKPELLFDFATLTGAARIAVGTEIAAMFTNDDALAEQLAAFSKTMNDPLWRLPLYAGYATMNDSTIADISNSTSSSYAGAITAALFLQRFVAEGLSWAHFDIMAWNVSSKPGRPEGGEAMAMQTVGEYLIHRYGK